MSTRAPVRQQRVNALGSGLIVLGSLQFGGVVVLGKIVTDGGLSIPSSLAVRFGAAALLLALAAALVFSLYLLGVDAVLDRTNSLTGSMWVSGAAAVALAATAAVSGTGDWPVGLRQWVPVLASAGFTAGAFVCLLAGLRRIGPVRASIVGATEPLAATFLAVIFLRESLAAATVVGGALILAGAVTASLARRDRSPAPPPP